MALIKMGQLVSGIRGTIGGVTYSANAASPYATAWARGPRSQTSWATSERSKLASWGKSWNALTDVQRFNWAVYAAGAAQAKTNSLGETYYASGFNWYVEINDARTRAGLAITASVPVNPAPAAPSQDSVYIRGTPTNTFDHFILLANWTAANYLVSYLWISSRLTLISVPMARYIFIHTRLGVVNGPEYRFDISTQFRTRYPTVRQGQRAYMVLYAMTPEGRMSAPWFKQANVL